MRFASGSSFPISPVCSCLCRDIFSFLLQRYMLAPSDKSSCYSSRRNLQPEMGSISKPAGVRRKLVYLFHQHLLEAVQKAKHTVATSSGIKKSSWGEPERKRLKAHTRSSNHQNKIFKQYGRESEITVEKMDGLHL